MPNTEKELESNISKENVGNMARAGGPKNEKSSLISNIFLGIAILIFLVALFKVLTAEEGENVTILGYSPGIILTEEMDPVIKEYGLVLLKETPYEDIEEGDIIFYDVTDLSGTEVRICREVVEVTDDGLVTQMANESIYSGPDPKYVTEDMLVGEVVWYSNILNTLITNPAYMAAIIVFIIIILVVSLIFVMARKRKKKDEIEENAIDNYFKIDRE